MTDFNTELNREKNATAIAAQIKEQVKTVAENKNIDIEYNVDDALSLLNKIDNGTIKTPTAQLDITANGVQDVTNYASADVNIVTPSQTKTATPTTSQQTVSPDSGYLLSSVTVNAVTSSIDSNITPLNIREGVSILGVQGNLAPDKPDQTKTINPTTSEQVVMADEGYELASVTVTAVTNEIDSNIQASNIKEGVSILGVEGTLVPDKPDQEKTVTPTTSQQIVEPDTGYELSKVTVNAVTSSIDANIQPENIKDGVTILGVEGTYEGSGGSSDIDAVGLLDGSITSIVIPDTVTSLRKSCFQNFASLSTVTIPTSITFIGEFAFSYCNALESIYYLGNVNQWVMIDFDVYSANPLYNNRFNNYLGKLYINNQVLTTANIDIATEIKDFAFYGCNTLTSLTIGSQVTKLGRGILANTGVTSITIPSSVVEMGDLFVYAENLTTITMEGLTPPTLASSSGGNGITTIYVPTESVDTYKNATNWSAYADKIQAIPTV